MSTIVTKKVTTTVKPAVLPHKTVNDSFPDILRKVVIVWFSDKTQNGTTTAPQKPKIVVAAKPVPAPVPVITNGDNDNDLLPQDRPQFKVTGMAKQQLTNVALPDISVLQVEKKDKNSPPVTKIIIYKSKDPNKKPTAKLIIEKVWIFVWESV